MTHPVLATLKHSIRNHLNEVLEKSPRELSERSDKLPGCRVVLAGHSTGHGAGRAGGRRNPGCVFLHCGGKYFSPSFPDPLVHRIDGGGEDSDCGGGEGRSKSR